MAGLLAFLTKGKLPLTLLHSFITDLLRPKDVQKFTKHFQMTWNACQLRRRANSLARITERKSTK